MGFSPEKFQRHLALAGYIQCESPLIERVETFLTKGGDRVIERLLTFERGNRSYALRPEFTASAAMKYAQEGRGVKRWQFHGPVFQEPEHTGEAFAHYHLGAELIGWGHPSADAELLGLVFEALMAQGLSEIRLVIGHAGLTREILESFQLDPQVIQFLLNQRGHLAAGGLAAVREKLQKFLTFEALEEGLSNEADDAIISTLMAITPRSSAFGGRTREEIAKRLVQKRHRIEDSEAIERALLFLNDWVQIEGTLDAALSQMQPLLTSDHSKALYENWKHTLSLLTSYGVSPEQIILRPDLSRVWDYYTGVVFEIRSAVGLPLGGGGRYDGLMRLFGDASDAPAIGFGLDVDALYHSFGNDRHDYPVIRVAVSAVEGGEQHAISIVRQLRAQNIPTILSDDSNGVHHVQVAADGSFTLNGHAYASVEQLTARLEAE